MVEKIAFTKEEIESRVKVPAIVEVELKHLIEERLKQSGLYYRIFSRIKTSESLARKYQVKSYNADKKIQDLVGLRVDVYFEDDLRICRQMMERMFSLVEWSESEQNEVEFKPVKINGVFRLPDYLKQQISDETWEMCIDDTFEIQLKTVFFEGWHEIEHDMKYKGGELWSGKNSFARYFNSILATLELCDKSLVTLFENLGHELYKERNWAGMMKAHYRLKMEERPMYPELEELLNNDRSEENLGKRLFKTSRQVLVEELLKQPRRVPINVNTIAALVNEAEDFDLEKGILDAVGELPKNCYEESIAEKKKEEQDVLAASPEIPNYTFTVIQDEVYYREGESLYRSQAKESVKRRIRAMHKIRLLVREILQIQQENCSDQELKKAQEQLNRLYDAFVKTHGYFCDRTNKMAFRQDNDYPLLSSLEVVDEDKNVTKADIFYKRTIRPRDVIDKVENAQEALHISLSEYNRVDIPYIRETGKKCSRN